MTIEQTIVRELSAATQPNQQPKKKKKSKKVVGPGAAAFEYTTCWCGDRAVEKHGYMFCSDSCFSFWLGEINDD